VERLWKEELIDVGGHSFVFVTMQKVVELRGFEPLTF
jgi:hypothetical protein